MLESNEKELIYLGKCGNKDAIETLINNHINLIRSMANKYTKYKANFEDLVQEGCIGIIEAINKFDLEKDIKFSTYATFWIKKCLSNYLYNNRLIRLSKQQYLNLRNYVNDKSRITKELGYEPTIEELSKILGLSILEISQLENHQIDTISFNTLLYDDTTIEEILASDNDVEQLIIEKDKKERLHRIIEQCDLKPRDITILNLRYGLDGSNSKPVPYGKIGDLFGVSDEAIRLSEKTILRKLRKATETKYMSVYMDKPENECCYIRS